MGEGTCGPVLSDSEKISSGSFFTSSNIVGKKAVEAVKGVKAVKELEAAGAEGIITSGNFVAVRIAVFV